MIHCHTSLVIANYILNTSREPTVAALWSILHISLASLNTVNGARRRSVFVIFLLPWCEDPTFVSS